MIPDLNTKPSGSAVRRKGSFLLKLDSLPQANRDSGFRA